MTKDEIQRYLDQEIERKSSEIEAYRNIMKVIGVEWHGDKEDKKK